MSLMGSPCYIEWGKDEWHILLLFWGILMLIIDQAHPEDIGYIAKISELVFSSETDSAPIGFNDSKWYFSVSAIGYLYKIVFNGLIIGGFVIFRTGQTNFQIERIFILQEYQNLGIGKKSLAYVFKRFPEAKVWYADVKPSWNKYSFFLTACGFFESGFITDSYVRYIKLPK